MHYGELKDGSDINFLFTTVEGANNNLNGTNPDFWWKNNKEVLLERLRSNLIEDLYLIVEAINNKTENIKPLELKKIIINKNLKKIENMKLVYFDVRGLVINRNIFNSNKFVILMGLLGFVVGIIIALTVTYFSNTKSN
mgnify:CR=1 FL=1